MVFEVGGSFVQSHSMTIIPCMSHYLRELQESTYRVDRPQNLDTYIAKLKEMLILGLGG